MNPQPHLPELRSKYGHPFHLWMTQEFDEKGWFLVQKSSSQNKAHDVTLFVQDPQGRYAITNKHSSPPGVTSSPAPLSRPGESFETAVKKNTLEEMGLDIDLKRFILHVTLDITHEREIFRWDSYVFTGATATDRASAPSSRPVKPPTWVMDSQLEEMSRRLRETGDGGLVYRSRLADAFLWSTSHPLVLREAKDKDRDKIDASPATKDSRVGQTKDCFWWAAEVHGLYAGAIGLRTHEKFLEFVGLNVHPMFRGRGIGHALVDYAIDRLRQDSFKKELRPETRLAADGGVWLLSNTPGYYLPSGFHLMRPEQVPPGLTSHIKSSIVPNLTALCHSL